MSKFESVPEFTNAWRFAGLMEFTNGLSERVGTYADFDEDLEWAQNGHLFLAKYFYPQYAYHGQFIYCDREDKKERGALFIQKKLHIDTIIQQWTPFNAICIDEKIVKGYYSAFALETHSSTTTAQMPEGLGNGCIFLSHADELLYAFPLQKLCDCEPLSQKWQKCTHPILTLELYLINFQVLQRWFRSNYSNYSWCPIRNKGYWTHVRIVPVKDVYGAIGRENITKNIVTITGWQEKIYYEEATGQLVLFPYKNHLAYFRRSNR